MSFILYLLTNTVDGKYYVGWTGQTLEQRWHDHCFNARAGESWHLSNAIRKDSFYAFVREVITTSKTKKEIKDLEKLWIVLLNSHNRELGYNMTYGGDGCCWDLIPDYRQKEIVAKRTKTLLWRAQNPTQAMIDRPTKISATHKEKGIRPIIYKQKGMSDAEFYGKDKAMQIHAKISASVYGVKKGVWITNGKENRVVLGTVYPEGWYTGRTQKGYKQRGPDSTEARLSKSIAQKLRHEKEKFRLEPVPVTG